MECSNSVTIATFVGSDCANSVLNGSRPLHKTEEIFKTNLAFTEKNVEAMECLSAAYTEYTLLTAYSPQQLKEVSRIFYLFGRCLYGKNEMEKGTMVFLLSLTVDLVSKNVISKIPFFPKIELECLPSHLSNIKDCGALRDRICELSEWLRRSEKEKIIEVAIQEGEENAFNFAYTLAFLGYSTQQLDKSQITESLGAIKKLYELSTAILDTIKHSHACNSVIFAKYLMRHFSNKLVSDPNGYFLLKEKAKYQIAHYNPQQLAFAAANWEAQELNRDAGDIIITNASTREEADELRALKFDKYRKAAAIVIQTEGFSPFQKLHFIDNAIRSGLECLKLKLAVVRKEELAVFSDALLRQMQLLNYLEFNYLFNAVEVEIYCDNIADAEEHFRSLQKWAEEQADLSEEEVEKLNALALALADAKRDV